MSITGTPGGEPVKCGLPVGDLGAGMFCAFGIVSAVHARSRNGQGQHVETSLFESALAMSVWESTEYWATGQVPQPLGSANRMSAPYQALRTKDGYLTLGANNERLWQRLCTALEVTHLLTDPRFITNTDRMANRDELAAELEEKLAAATTDSWVDLLLAAGVPAGPDPGLPAGARRGSACPGSRNGPGDRPSGRGPGESARLARAAEPDSGGAADGIHLCSVSTRPKYWVSHDFRRVAGRAGRPGTSAVVVQP